MRKKRMVSIALIMAIVLSGITFDFRSLLLVRAEENPDTEAVALNDDENKSVEFNEDKVLIKEELEKAQEIEASSPENKVEDLDSDDKAEAAEKQQLPLYNHEVSATIFDSSSYSLEDRSDNTRIRLEGLLPKDAVVKAYRVPVKLGNKEVLLAYDIKIFYGDGKEFQPKKDEPIKVSFESPRLKNIDKTQIFHMENEKAVPEKVTDSVKFTKLKNKVEFKVNSFSIYVIGKESDKPEENPGDIHRYEFYTSFAEGSDGVEAKPLDEPRLIEEDTQELYEGESLREPYAPDVKEHIFEGWYTEDGKPFAAWDVVEPKVKTGGKLTKLYARYRTTVIVYYKKEARMPSEENPVKVIYSQKYERGSKINFTDVPLQTDEGYALIGWSKDPNDENTMVENGVTTVDSDMRLFPIIKQAYWITYNANGGTFVDPDYVLKGNTSKEPSEPTKAGYSFGGWFEDATLKTRYSFGKPISKNLKLYAKWIPAETTYTVVFWEQNVSDKKNTSDENKTYTFKESVVRKAVTGTAVGLLYNDKRKDINNSNYHFHYNPNNSDIAAVVKADGSTVLNVRYDRDLFIINFYDRYGNLYRKFEGLYEQSLKNNNYDWPYEYTWRNRTDGLGYTFLGGFILPRGSYNLSDDKNVDSLYRRKTATMTLDISGNQSMLSQAAEIKHYLQNLDGSFRHFPENKVNSTATSFTITKKYTGFTPYAVRRKHSEYLSGRYGYVWTIPTWEDYRYGVNGLEVSLGNQGYTRYTEMDILHKRDSYELKYLYGINSKEIDGEKESLLFEAPIEARYEKPEPERPKDDGGSSLIPDYYHFKGWFSDPNGQQRFNFDGSQIMPSSNVNVYALWEPNRVSVKFDLDGGKAVDGRSEITTQVFDAGNMAVKPENPSKADYHFAGWVDKKTDYPVNFEKIVTENLEVKARWVSDKEYKVTYDSNGGVGNRRTGPKLYVPGSPAKVIGIGSEWGWAAPKGSIGFLHWNTKPDDSGTVVLPGDELPYGKAHNDDPHNQKEDSPVLYAIWSKPLDSTLIYDYNGADKAQDKIPVKFHEDIIVGTSPATNIKDENTKYLDIPIRNHYEFLGWSRYSKDLPSNKHLLEHKNEIIRVDSAPGTNQDEKNILYAQWRRKALIQLNVNIDGIMGDENQDFTFKVTIIKPDGEVISRPDSYLKASSQTPLVIGGTIKEHGVVSGDPFLDGGTLHPGYKVIIEEIDLEKTGHTLEKIEVQAINLEPNETPGGIGSHRITDKTKGGKWEITIGEDSTDLQVDFTNYRDIVGAPTGLVQTRIPFYVLFAFSIIVIAYILMRKRSDKTND